MQAFLHQLATISSLFRKDEERELHLQCHTCKLCWWSSVVLLFLLVFLFLGLLAVGSVSE